MFWIGRKTFHGCKVVLQYWRKTHSGRPNRGRRWTWTVFRRTWCICWNSGTWHWNSYFFWWCYHLKLPGRVRIFLPSWAGAVIVPQTDHGFSPIVAKHGYRWRHPWHRRSFSSFLSMQNPDSAAIRRMYCRPAPVWEYKFLSASIHRCFGAVYRRWSSILDWFLLYWLKVPIRRTCSTGQMLFESAGTGRSGKMRFCSKLKFD